MDLTIDRAHWLRGGKLGRSELRNIQGNMCCLGFYAEQAGCEHLTGVIHPGALCDIDQKLVPYLVKGFCNTSWAKVAMRINDTPELSDSEREIILIEHFKSIDTNLIFIGEQYEDKQSGAEYPCVYS